MISILVKENLVYDKYMISILVKENLAYDKYTGKREPSI